MEVSKISIPPGRTLRGNDVTTLAASIKSVGLLHPIVVTPDGSLIAGSRRLAAAKSLGWTNIPVTIASNLADAKLALLAERDENVERKDLTPTEKVTIYDAIMVFEKAAAKARQAEGGGDHRSKTKVVTNNDKLDPKPSGAPEAEKQESVDTNNGKRSRGAPRAAETAAKAVGSSASTIAKMKELQAMAAATQSFQKFVDEANNTNNVDRAYRNALKENKKNDLKATASREVAIPTGLFDVIVIDPPWPMNKIERDTYPNQTKELDYPTMTEEELQKIHIPTDENCHIFLWTTHRFLPMALRLLVQWNFAYVCTFVWHKPGGFQPFGLPQYNCEFAIYAHKGAPQFFDTKAFPVCFNATRGAHSEKPEEFYSMVRRCTEGRRLDMFGRRAIDGFTSWGNEAPTNG